MKLSDTELSYIEGQKWKNREMDLNDTQRKFAGKLRLVCVNETFAGPLVLECRIFKTASEMTNNEHSLYLEPWVMN
jgi:hypothetical protein